MTMRKMVAAVGMLALGLSLKSAGTGAATLRIQVVTATGKSGSVKVALFQGENGFPKGTPFHAETIQVADGKGSVVFKDLQPGVYAVTAYLDKNNNGKLDTNMVGKPTEPYGISNNARSMLGPPKFDDAKFQLPAGEISITLELK